jgi:hypothetical protein
MKILKCLTAINVFFTLLLSFAAFSANATRAAENVTKEPQWQFNSGVKEVQLFELYTSEGCSSCPPADRWYSQLKLDQGLWQHFVPVTFHVDYWDYLGWQDSFASQDYSRRQRRYESDGNTNGVYTPGFVLAGREWKNWFSSRQESGPAASQEIVGELSASFNGKAFEANFAALADQQASFTLHIALLGFDLSSDVKHGENSGRKLKHDFVVLEMESFPENDAAKNTWSGIFEPLGKVLNTGNAKDRALALWVSKKGNQKPIQAVGNFL